MVYKEMWVLNDNVVTAIKKYMKERGNHLDKNSQISKK